MTRSWPRESATGRFTPVADALQGYLDRTGLAESLERLEAVEQWAGAVGAQVSRVTRAVEVRGDELVVEVLSSAWIAELSMMRTLILERLNSARSGPPIGSIRFRLAESSSGAGTGMKRQVRIKDIGVKE